MDKNARAQVIAKLKQFDVVRGEMDATVLRLNATLAKTTNDLVRLCNPVCTKPQICLDDDNAEEALAALIELADKSQITIVLASDEYLHCVVNIDRISYVVLVKHSMTKWPSNADVIDKRPVVDDTSDGADSK